MIDRGMLCLTAHGFVDLDVGDMAVTLETTPCGRRLQDCSEARLSWCTVIIVTPLPGFGYRPTTEGLS